VELLEDTFRKRLERHREQIVEACKMVHRLHDVVNIRRLAGLQAQGVGLVNIPGLLLAQARTLDAVGIVGQLDLRKVVESSFETGGLFFSKLGEEGHGEEFRKNQTLRGADSHRLYQFSR
jgi:hypothetical protein